MMDLIVNFARDEGHLGVTFSTNKYLTTILVGSDACQVHAIFNVFILFHIIY